MKKHILMIISILTAAGLVSSCVKDNGNNPDYLSATISGANWTSNSINAGSDTCTGYTYVEADNDDGSLFYLDFPTSASGNYGVASNDDCSVEYIDPHGQSYSVQGGSMNLNTAFFGGTSGSFQGIGINDFNYQDQVRISGSFNVN